MAERILKLCAQKGVKLTKQREIVARIISDATDHPDVEEIYARASVIDKKISIATVYRTVKILQEHNIVDKHDFGDGKARYEETTDEHHDHLIDIRNNKIIEFQNEAIEKLQHQIATQLGYKLIGHKLELYCVPLGEKNN